MRLLASIIVALVTSAVALLIAAAALGDFKISTLTFPILVVEFALILLMRARQSKRWSTRTPMSSPASWG